MYKLILLKAVLSIAKDAGPQILEPIMKVQITTDGAYLRSLLQDLTNRRRGQIDFINQDRHLKVIDAHVPLKELIGYSTELRSTTKGTGSFSMEFDGYEKTPEKLQNELLESLGLFDLLH